MSELRHAVHNDFTRWTGTSATFAALTGVDLLSAELWGSSDCFLCFWAGYGGGNTADPHAFARIHDGAAALAYSDGRREPVNSGAEQLHPYMFMERKTLAATPETFALQQASNGTDTSWVNDSRSLALNLDDLQAADFAYDEDDMTAGGKGTDVSSTAWVDGASVVIGDGVSDYKIFVTHHWQIDSSTDDYRVQLDVGGTPRCHIQDQGDKVTEIHASGFTTVLKAPAADTTVKVQVRTTADLHDCDNTRIFALRLNAFVDFLAAYTDGVIVTHVTDNVTQEIDTISKTTDTGITRSWCALADNVHAGLNRAQIAQSRLNQDIDAVGEVTVAGDLQDNDTGWRSSDTGASGVPWVGFGEVVDVPDGSTLKLILDARADYDTTPSWTTDDAGLAMFTWELVPVGDFMPASFSQQMVSF